MTRLFVFGALVFVAGAPTSSSVAGFFVARSWQRQCRPSSVSFMTTRRAFSPRYRPCEGKDMMRAKNSASRILRRTTVTPPLQRSSSSLSASSDNDKEQVSETKIMKTLCSGDYAGLSATFSAKTGELIRVPEQLVPKDMIEWGQIPSCLEVLVSEKWKSYYSQLARQTVTILPETGCGVDNLETVKRNETMEPSNIEVDSGCISMDYIMPSGRPEEKRTRVETVFDIGTDDDDEQDDEEKDDDDTEWRIEDGEMRVRVIVDFTSSPTNGFQLQTPIVVNVELRTSRESSEGTIADGGGLDARTVTKLLGDDLNVDKSFAEQERGAAPFEKDPVSGMSVLTMPGGIRVACSPHIALPWELVISLEGEGSQQQVRKRYTKEMALPGKIDTIWKDYYDESSDDDFDEDEIEEMQPEVFDMSDVESIKSGAKFQGGGDVDEAQLAEIGDTDEAFRYMLEQKQAWETMRREGPMAMRPSAEEEEQIAEFASELPKREGDSQE